MPRWRARASCATRSCIARCGWSRSAAAVPWLLYDGARELDAHPLLDLLARPNRARPARLPRGALRAPAARRQRLCRGGDARGARRARAARAAARPHAVVPGADGWPEAYEYAVAGARCASVPATAPPPILHLSLFHPLDDHYGFAPLEAARWRSTSTTRRARWNKALLDNAARPSGALVYSAKAAAISPTSSSSG
jgi:phage portal protein BeeE